MVNSRTVLLLVVLLLTLLGQNTFAAEATVDRNTVRVNETFELTVNMTSTPLNQPDLSALPNDLQVMRSSNFYRKSTINGQSTVQAGWNITIKALAEGLFTIPSLTIDGHTTQPVTIKVLAAVSSAEINGQADAIRIVSEIDAESIYVQQQLLYTIRLYRSVRAQYASLTEPELEGALIERLGDDIQFETVINSVRYIVLERKYAIFPQRSGNFEISGVTYNAEVSTARQSFGTLGALRGRSRSVSLSSDDKNIEVKPIPTGSSGWWLPAAAVNVSQSWKPDTSLEIGAPVTWTYTIEAEGLTATQLPDILPSEIDGVKFYPEKPQSVNEIVNGKLVGKRTQSIAVIATEPGSVTIPAIEINWWDVQTDTPEVTTMPSKELLVNGEMNIPEPAIVETDTQPSITETTSNLNSGALSPESPLLDNQTIADDRHLLFWQLATGLFILLWISTLLWRRSQRQKSSGSQDVTLAASRQGETNVNHHASLNTALKSNSLETTITALIATARSINPDIHSVADIKALISDEETKRLLTKLERAKYAKSTEEWNNTLLKTRLKQIWSQIAVQDDKHKKATQLVALHATDDIK